MTIAYHHAIKRFRSSEDEYFTVVIETDLADVKLFNKNGEALFYEHAGRFAAKTGNRHDERRRGIKV